MSATQFHVPKQIHSFFKHSYVKDKYTYEDNMREVLTENIFIDYDTPTYIRIMKRFTTPDYETFETKETNMRDNPTQKTFLLRFYLPKSAFSHELKNQRIKDIVVMFNGLNETDRYDFYDLMGSQFADNGIAAVLLPTPFHLNRRIMKNKDGSRKSKEKAKPIKIAAEHPDMFYYNFKRSIHELEHLVDKLTGKITDEQDCSFYKSFFAQKALRVSLLGFSLGGLRALGSFLNNTDKYHSCITFNTTANPFKAAIENLDRNKENSRKIESRNEFDKIHRDLKDALGRGDFKETNYLKIFKCIYSFKPSKTYVNKLKSRSDKFLMIKAGGDKIASVKKSETNETENTEKYIADPDYGLNCLTIAGVDHIPTMDEKWDHWLTMVGVDIINFIQNANIKRYTHEGVEEGIKKIIGNTAFFKKFMRKYKYREILENTDFINPFFDSLKKEIKNKATIKKLEELYFMSKAFYPKFSELLGKISNLGHMPEFVTSKKSIIVSHSPYGNSTKSRLEANQELHFLEIENGWFKFETSIKKTNTGKPERTVCYLNKLDGVIWNS